MQRLGYLHELEDELAIVPSEPQKAPDLCDSGGVGHLLITLIFSLLVAAPWAEMMCPRCVICLWKSSYFEGLSLSLPCSSFWKMASSLMRWLAGSFEKMTISLRYMIHQLRLRSLRQVSINHWKVTEVLVSSKGILYLWMFLILFTYM